MGCDNRQVVVPPVEQFLDVQVAADQEAYEPGDAGRLTVTTHDHEGQPVSAEVSLAMVDESVLYIQQDYAGDPRQVLLRQPSGPSTVQNCRAPSSRSLTARLVLDDDAPDALVEGTADRSQLHRGDGQATRPACGHGVQPEPRAKACVSAGPKKRRRRSWPTR